MKIFLVIALVLQSAVGLSQISTGCVTWANNVLPSNEVISAAENLCSRHLIGNYVDDNALHNFLIMNAAYATLYALYNGNIPSTLPADNFPTFFGDLDNIPFQSYQAMKAMCFLEYDDGRPCISRDYSDVYPTKPITTGNILRMLYEALNIPPDMQGYNIFNHNPSSFFPSVFCDDYNYGYFKRAFEDHVLGSFVYNQDFPVNQNVTAGEFFLVVLSNMANIYRIPYPVSNNYYNPNNVQLSNANIPSNISRGVFKTYEQAGFKIPSGGLGLNFTYSYHSDWIDIPTLGTSNYFCPVGNYTEQLARERTFPLGICWTHTYNIYAQSVINSNDGDQYLIIRWGDGKVEVYNVQQNKFESKGVYDRLIVTAASNGHIIAFNIISKDQITTEFHFSSNSIIGFPAFYEATQITDQNNHSISLNYERSTCASGQPNCVGGSCFGASAERLSRVTDNFSGRSLSFSYLQGCDLLNSVTDNSGRTIQFFVSRATLNLNAVTNARNYTTQYTYGQTDVDNHLLESITRPDGNTINNTYYARKLKQTQTPNYLTSVNFTTSYAAAPISTQSIVTTTPFSGTQYSVTYNQNATGTTSNISSSGSNISFSYNDSQNPTLPTSIIDNQTGVSQTFQYDAMGNLLQSAYSSGGLTQNNHFTYDGANHLTSHTWPNNTVMTYQYNEQGKKTSEAALNYKMDYKYSPDGQLITEIDGNQVVTNFAYNQYGNLNSISIDGTPIAYTADYDNVSRIKTITDANQIPTSYQFDPNDNLTGIIQDPNGLNITTSYFYDRNDNLVTITPPEGADYILTYNTSDDLISEEQLGLKRMWGYNQDGSLSSFIDKNHTTFSYSYYPTGDINEGKLKSNGVQSYTYDSNHLPSTVVTGQQENGSVAFQYDQLMRPNYIAFSSPSFSSDVSYVYDISGNITQINLIKDGKSLNYFYDGLNRLQTIKDWNGNSIITYNYRNNGWLDNEVLGNGMTVFHHYDKANRLDSLYSLKSDGATLIHAVGCSFDNNDNHTRESAFVNWSGSPGVIYPAQSSTKFTYDQQYNWLLTGNNQHSTNDNNGNITNNAFSKFSAGSYDLHNNLVSCTVDGKTKKFLYDALESRYGSDSSLFTIDHINKGNVLASKKINNPNSNVIYVYSPYGLVCSIDPENTDKTYYLYDLRGSTLATIDKNQSVTDYYKYDPWGNITESSSVPGKKTPFLFVGQFGVMYESPHLYYMRARYYDPTIGRFLGSDSKWSTNLFPYAGNNPIANIDPNGNNWFSTLLNWVSSKLFGMTATTEYASPKIPLVGGLVTHTTYTGVVDEQKKGVINYNVVSVNNQVSTNVSSNNGIPTYSIGSGSVSAGFDVRGYSNSLTASFSGVTYDYSYTNKYGGISGSTYTVSPVVPLTPALIGASSYAAMRISAIFEAIPEIILIPAL